MREGFDSIILDIDGTIWNTTGVVSVAWNKAISEHCPKAKKVNAQMLQKEFGKPMNEIADHLWQDLTKEEKDILLSYCCTEEQIALKNNTLDLCYPNVIETIKELSPDINFYIVSNCQNGYIELMLEKTNLAPYIKDFECYGRTGKGKAENILMLASRNQLIHPVYIGDTQGDCDACFQSGVSFIFAAYGFGSASNYYEKITDFSQLKHLIQEKL